MNGPHDMGGMQCYGPVKPEPDEPIFHADWEKRALALTVAMGFCGNWNIDVSRHARETLPPVFYLGSSYYQIWLAGLEKLLLQHGMAENEELLSGKVCVEPAAVKRVVTGAETGAVLMKGGPVDRAADCKPAFAVGDRVQTRNIQPSGHTRLPGYARAKKGRISSVQGFHVFPDTNAHGGGEQPQWLYSVSFQADELFGGTAEVGNEVMLDCWEEYLEIA